MADHHIFFYFKVNDVQHFMPTEWRTRESTVDGCDWQFTWD